MDGERGRIRTCDPCLKRALLYQLSYAPALFFMISACDFVGARRAIISGVGSRANAKPLVFLRCVRIHS